MKVLSMDFGTSSLKMAILDEQLRLLRSTSEAYSYHVRNTDWVELPAEDVIGAVIRAAEAFREELPEVGLICFDTFSPSLVFLDREGKPLYPIITHLDRRSKEQTQEILRVIGKDAFQSITGVQPFTGGVSVTSLLWMMENMPEVMKQTFRIGHLPTYIYHWLTGRFAMDPVNASMSGLYETTKWGGWSEDILSAFSIPASILPEIRPAGGIEGTLTAEAAVLLGLKEGIPVALGSNDCATAQVAAGNRKAGSVLIVSGSSEMISVLSDKPYIRDEYYLRNAVTPGQWQIFSITASGFVLDWFRKELCKELTEEQFYRELLPSVLEREQPERSVTFLPYMAGDRQSLTPKRGGFEGLTLETSRETLLASILVGFHEPVVRTMALCREFLAIDPCVKLTGGMVTEPFIRFKEKIFPGVRFQVVSDCSIIGSAALALEHLNGEGKGKGVAV